MITFNSEEHSYQLDGQPIPSVTTILKDAGLIDFSKINADILDRASKFGSAVHLACELYDKGDLNEDHLDINLLPYLDAWRKFLKDTGFKIQAIEEKVASDKYWYAGRLDRRGRLFDKVTVLDIKTGSGILPSTAIQLAAYQECVNQGLHMKDKVKEREVVQLKADGTYALAPDKFFSKNDFSVFLSALNLKNWRARNGK